MGFGVGFVVFLSIHGHQLIKEIETTEHPMGARDSAFVERYIQRGLDIYIYIYIGIFLY